MSRHDRGVHGVQAAVAVAVVGVWVAVFPWMTAPFQGSKALLPVLAACLAVGASGVWGKAWRRPHRDALRTMGLWAAALTVSTWASPARFVAFWGNDDRWLGAWVWLAVLLLAALWGLRPAVVLLATGLAVGSLVAVGTVALARAWPHLWQGDLAPWLAAYQAGGTLGNGAFLGTALAGLPLFFWGLARTTTAGRWRWFWRGAILWTVVGVGLSDSRAGWLGLAVGAWVWGLMRVRGRARWAWLVGGVGLPVLAVAWAATHPNTWAWDLLHRNGTLVQRWIVWQATWALLLRHPVQALLGFGADTLGVFFPQVYPPVLIGYEPDLQAHVYDRAHTLVLDLWVQFGVLGGLALLATLVAVYRGWRRHRARAPEVADGTLAALAGLLTTWVWHFPTPTTLVMAALWAATLIGRASWDLTLPPRDAVAALWGAVLAFSALAWLPFAAGGWGVVIGWALVAVVWCRAWPGEGLPVTALVRPTVLAGLVWLAPWGSQAWRWALAVGIASGVAWAEMARPWENWGWASVWRVGEVLLLLPLVLRPLAAEGFHWQARREAAAGNVAAAIRAAEQAWALFPRERTALTRAGLAMARHLPPTPTDWADALAWLERAPPPRTAAWWHTVLWAVDRATAAGVLSPEERAQWYAAAHAAFPGNLAWRSPGPIAPVPAQLRPPGGGAPPDEPAP